MATTVLPSGLSYTGFNGALTQVNGGGVGTTGSSVNGRPAGYARLAQLLKSIPRRQMKEVLRTLVDNGSGGSISNGTYYRRQALPGNMSMGGLINIEQVTLASGTAGAADITILDRRVFNQIFGAPTNSSGTITWPADASGNAGGGKRGF